MTQAPLRSPPPSSERAIDAQGSPTRPNEGEVRMKAASIRRGLPLSAAAALALAIPAAAQATTVHCGQTIRNDVTLDADLDCSAGGTGGLIIGRDGVTL